MNLYKISRAPWANALFSCARVFTLFFCVIQSAQGEVVPLSDYSGQKFLTPSPALKREGVVGDECESTGQNRYCLAIRYVVFKDRVGGAVVSMQQAISNLRKINSIFGQCGITFQIESFITVDPRQYSLRFNIANFSELDDIRARFAKPDSLLLVTTGKWNRDGSLGESGANAWTVMPGGGVPGTILESAVGDYAQILAHELGHYLGLDHATNRLDLMNPVIYSHSSALSQGECRLARAEAVRSWGATLR